MKTIYIAIITVLMFSAVSLEAQEDPGSRPDVPNASAYTDVLPKGTDPASKKVETSAAVVRAGLPGKRIGQEPRVNLRLEAKTTPADDLAIDRVIQEAKMRLEVIAEKSSETAEEAQLVLDEALALLAQRLEEAKARKTKEAAEKKNTGEKGTEVTVEDPVGIEKVTKKVSAKAKPSAPEDTEEDTEVGQPVPGEILPSKAVRMYRWAEQLRTLADQLVEEADKLGSRGN